MSFEDVLRVILREELAALKVQKPEDKLIGAKEVAEILQVTPKFIYAHASEYPFTVILTNTEKRTVRFSYNRLQKWIEQRIKLQESLK